MVQGKQQLEQCPVRGWFFGRDRSTEVEVFDATTHAWVLSNVFKAATASPSPPPSPVGVQDHQGLEPSASIIGIQDHQGLEHQTMV